MARTVANDPRLGRHGLAENPLTCAFRLERVTRIEPALSAWESAPSRLLCGLTCGAGCPRATVRGPVVTGVKWHGDPGLAVQPE
jgi:hypothetical protein